MCGVVFRFEVQVGRRIYSSKHNGNPLFVANKKMMIIFFGGEGQKKTKKLAKLKLNTNSDILSCIKTS